MKAPQFQHPRAENPWLGRMRQKITKGGLNILSLPDGVADIFYGETSTTAAPIRAELARALKDDINYGTPDSGAEPAELKPTVVVIKPFTNLLAGEKLQDQWPDHIPYDTEECLEYLSTVDPEEFFDGCSPGQLCSVFMRFHDREKAYHRRIDEVFKRLFADVAYILNENLERLRLVFADLAKDIFPNSEVLIAEPAGDIWMKPNGGSLHGQVVKTRKAPSEPQAHNVRHPNLVFEVYEGECVIAPDMSGIPTLMEVKHISTETLQIRIKCLVDAMLACHALHTNGLVHHDFKPNNVLVVGDGTESSGRLFDSEFVRTRDYYEESGTQIYMPWVWYPYLRPGSPIGNGSFYTKDSFAAGVSLLEQFCDDEDFSGLIRDISGCDVLASRDRTTAQPMPTEFDRGIWSMHVKIADALLNDDLDAICERYVSDSSEWNEMRPRLPHGQHPWRLPDDGYRIVYVKREILVKLLKEFRNQSEFDNLVDYFRANQDKLTSGRVRTGAASFHLCEKVMSIMLDGSTIDKIPEVNVHANLSSFMRQHAVPQELHGLLAAMISPQALGRPSLLLAARKLGEVYGFSVVEEKNDSGESVFVTVWSG